MPKKLAVIVSDLHIGRGNLQDDFVLDRPFEGFCSEVSDYALRQGLDLLLILNGDAVDLWELVTDAELEDDGAPEIRKNLFFPIAPGDRATEDRAVQYFSARIDEALRAHWRVARALSRLLERDRNRVVYVIGNHDHGLVNPRLQSAFQNVLDAHGDGTRGARLEFAHFLADADLRLYVEHGHQFSAGESAYEDVTSFAKEAPGYHFLRFVWNRVQARSERAISEATEQLVRIILRDILLGDDDSAKLAQFRYLLEYFQAIEDGVVPEVAEVAGLEDIYKEWRKDGTVSARQAALKALKRVLADVFKSSHRKDERVYERRAPTADEGGPYPIRNIRLPGRPREVSLEGRNIDGYWEGVMSRFKKGEAPFPKLDPAEISTVFLGHTHRRLLYELPVKNGQGARYWNVGAWARGPRPSYGWVTNDGNPLEWRGVKEL